MNNLSWRALPLEINALTDDTTKEPTQAHQFGVQEPGGKVRIFGDQDWVRYGEAAKQLDGVTMVREVTIIWGDWKEVGS